ncbi:hypothetical protein D3C81_201820 [compost metagenome]
MKRLYRIPIGLMVLLLMIQPLGVSHAAGSTISIKKYTYKGYPYLQIVDSAYKAPTNAINKTLKWHAVNNAKTSAEFKKESGIYSVSSEVELLFNQDGKLSVGYIDYLYNGGAHGDYDTTIFNYDLTTGKQISLTKILNNDEKIRKAKTYISSVLNEKLKQGDEIYPGVINDPPLDVTGTQFYLRSSGITIRFRPYDVAPYYLRFVEVTIPYSVIN